MTTNHIGILGLIIFITLGGYINNYSKPNDGIIINIQEEILKKPWNLPELFDNIQIIPLETNDTYLIKICLSLIDSGNYLIPCMRMRIPYCYSTN